MVELCNRLDTSGQDVAGFEVTAEGCGVGIEDNGVSLFHDLFLLFFFIIAQGCGFVKSFLEN